MELSNEVKGAVIILLTLITLGILLGFAVRQAGFRQVPVCEEDAVLVGMGPFENGRWDSYVCGPSADDYVSR